MKFKSLLQDAHKNIGYTCI